MRGGAERESEILGKNHQILKYYIADEIFKEYLLMIHIFMIHIYIFPSNSITINLRHIRESMLHLD